MFSCVAQNNSCVAKKCKLQFIAMHTLNFKVASIAILIYLPQNVSVKTNAKRNDNALLSNLRRAYC
jgi:hypothetical protein